MCVARRWGGFLALVMILSGCTSLQAPTTFEYFHDPDVDLTQEHVWPQAPENPRLRYLGSLVGEPNFPRNSTSKLLSGGQNFLKKLVGLNAKNRKQIILQRPQSGVVDSKGNILVTDVSRQAVYRFDPDHKTLDIWEYAAKGLRFESPIGVAVDGRDQVWVADSRLGFVIHLDREGSPLAQIGKDQLVRPTGLAIDREKEELYVADTARSLIRVFDLHGQMLRSFGERGEGDGQLNGPTFLAFRNHRLYVSDTLNARVQVFDPEGAWQGTFGKRGLYLGDLTRPKGVAVDQDENVYVVESFYDYLLIFNKQREFLLPVGGSGHQPGQFYLPSGVWLDQDQHVYVADMFNGRIEVFQRLMDIQ